MKAKIVLPIAISILLFSLVSGTRFVEKGVEVTSAVNSGQGFPSGLGESSVDWWPMFHHDLMHTGYSTSTAPNTNQTPWNYRTGSYVTSSPAVVDGMVFVGSGDNNVYALNATTGTKVWNYTTSGPVNWSSPAVAGGVVYVGSNDGKVYALNAMTGAKVWSYTTGGAVYSSPAVDGGMVFVGSCNNNTYALNASTGAFIWSYTTNSYVYSSPAVAAGKVYVGSGKIYEGFGNGAIYCLEASSGAFIWNYTTGGWVESSPAVAAGIVYVGSNDHNVYALNAATGTLVWSFRTCDWVFSSPAVVDGVVYVGSLDGHIYAGRSIDVYLWNSIEPAPMGIADYGIGPSGPYEYVTKSFVGTVTIASLLTNRSSDYIVSFQLNVEFEFNTSHGQYVFWMQNTATVRTFGSILTLENFGSNVWNWTKFFAQIDPSGISGKGQFGTPQDPYGYVCTRDGIFTPFNRTTPITITLNVTSGVSPSGEPTVSFAYDIGDGLITYDTITFTNVTGLTSSGFKVTGFGLNPAGVFCNAALILGGFLVTTDVLSDVQLQLEYWNGHNYQIVPNAYNFGTNTAETIDNVLCGFSHHPGNGKIFAEILPGAGQLGELYNQFQTGVINITSPLTSGTLYVTNASDPNATAWKIPFVSGEVTVTLYPGYYNLQLYNQYGKLFDQGNFTVSAGQTLYLQTPLGPPTHNIAAINAASAKTVIGEGFNASINITVANQGSYPETFNVTARADAVGVNDGLVGYWSFDEGSGTTAQDSSENHNDGTIYGATWTDGKFGKALSFDGTDDSIVVPGSPSLNNIADAVTIAAWVKLEQVPAEAYGFIIAGGYTYVAYAYVGDPAGVRFNFGICTAPGVGDDLQQEFWKQYGAELPYLPYNQWYYVVWTYDSSGYTAIYVNGNPYANTTLMSGKIYNFGWGLTINDDAKLHKGILDELRIYNRTLNQQEIRAVAGSGAIQTWTVSLASGDSTTVVIAWNTSGFAKGNYTISAFADTVPGETDTEDNTCTDGWVKVTVAGDIDGSGRVDVGDLGLLGVAWFSTPSSPSWNPNADINNSNRVDLGDLGILGVNWFKT